MRTTGAILHVPTSVSSHGALHDILRLMDLFMCRTFIEAMSRPDEDSLLARVKPNLASLRPLIKNARRSLEQVLPSGSCPGSWDTFAVGRATQSILSSFAADQFTSIC